MLEQTLPRHGDVSASLCIVKALVEHGANKNKSIVAPLMAAAMSENLSIFQELEQMGFDIKTDGSQAL